MTYSSEAAISSCVWNIVFKTIANWSRRRLYVHRRRRLHCRRYWCNKFWKNVIFCCRRSVWVAFHNLRFLTHNLICIHTIFLSRYLCEKDNKGFTIFRSKSKLWYSLNFFLSQFLRYFFFIVEHISVRIKLRSNVFKSIPRLRSANTQRYIYSHRRE